MQAKARHNHLPSIPLIVMLLKRPSPGRLAAAVVVSLVLLLLGPLLGFRHGEPRLELRELRLAPGNLPAQVVDLVHVAAHVRLGGFARRWWFSHAGERHR